MHFLSNPIAAAAEARHAAGGSYHDSPDAPHGIANKRARRAQFVCLECGKKFYTVAAAERASFGDNGCPGCGGSDIDAAT